MSYLYIDFDTIMELSELTSSTMNSIDEDKELTSEEKESLKAKTYREAWSPDLFIRFNGEANFFTLILKF